MLKAVGYLISSVSVVLLGIVSWSSAAKHPLLLACLVLGMAASIAGMCLRWMSHRQDQAEKQALARATRRTDQPQGPVRRPQGPSVTAGVSRGG